jgi:hypothetical protein
MDSDGPTYEVVNGTEYPCAAFQLQRQSRVTNQKKNVDIVEFEIPPLYAKFL